MKKLLLTLLSVLMVFTLATTNVFAEGDADTQDTELTYKIDSTYTWSVPASATLSTTDTDIEVKLESVSLAECDGVRIVVSSANGFKVKNGTTELAYTLKDGETTLTYENDVVIEAVTSTTKTLKAKLSAEGTVAGKYSDTLTFTASIIPVGAIYNESGVAYQILIPNKEIEEFDTSGVAELITQENSKVILPSGTGIIESQVFEGCTNLASITIPNTVTEIKDLAFNGCENLNTVIFEEGSLLTKIGSNAFNYCRNLTSINIPASVTEILANAFDTCFSLESITLPSSLETIGDAAFSGTSLTSITIPASVTGIGESAFGNCSSLATVTFEEGSNLEIIGGNAFRDTGISSLTIPDGVTSIGELAFAQTGISSLTIPSSVRTIGEDAFIGIGNVIIDESYITNITDSDTRSYFPWGAEKINGNDPVNPWED